MALTLNSVPQLNASTMHLYQQALGQHAAGNSTAAVDLLRQHLASNPRDAIAHNDLGVLLYQQGDRDAAHVHYRRASELAPTNVTFHKNLADLHYVELGNVEEALREYIRVLELVPGDLETLQILANICIAHEQFDDARCFLELVRAAVPDDETVATLLAEIERHQALRPCGEEAIAIKDLEERVRTSPADAAAWNDLGVLCHQAGNTVAALHHYQKAVKFSPQNTTFRKNLADFQFFVTGDTDEAIHAYLDLHRENPADGEVLMNLGLISRQVGRPEEARLFLEQALALDPGNSVARQVLTNLVTAASATPETGSTDDFSGRYRQALALAEADRTAEAIILLTELVHDDPDFALGHNDLGTLQHRQGDRLRSLYHYEKAVRLAPHNPTCLKNLADFYWFELGQEEEAAELYNSALNRDPNNLETLVNLGWISAALGHQDKARRILERGLQLAAGNQRLQELARILDHQG